MGRVSDTYADTHSNGDAYAHADTCPNADAGTNSDASYDANTDASPVGLPNGGQAVPYGMCLPVANVGENKWQVSIALAETK